MDTGNAFDLGESPDDFDAGPPAFRALIRCVADSLEQACRHVHPGHMRGQPRQRRVNGYGLPPGP